MRHYLLSLSVVLSTLFFSVTYGQQTVGLFKFDSTSVEGYTLVPPFSNPNVYLLNNCGHVVKSWKTSGTAGANTLLKPNGNLLRSVQTTNPFQIAGGNGGRLEEYNWEGELVWHMNLSSDSFSQHHDFELMPNGNLLVLMWELVPYSVAAANGKVTNGMEEDVWQESIWELKPKADSGATIVWKWSAMKHLVQNVDMDKLNYGVISEHPELIDFNSPVISHMQDWLHFNSLDYNEKLDQIMISCHGLSEIYIIDHSTSDEESDGHFGGRHNKGGDILYRYGNPQVYGRGTASDQVSFKQHDAQWIKKGFANEGQVIFFNNGGPRGYSSIDRFAPNIQLDGTYLLESGKPFGPADYSWTYTAKNPKDFYSAVMSAVQPLENGHLLITESTKGHVFEIDKNKKIVWSYVNPVGPNSATEQGKNPLGNNVFRAYKYSVDSDAFKNKSIVEGDRLEINPLANHCDDTTSNNTGQDTTNHDTTGGGSGSIKLANLQEAKIFPNPCTDYISIHWNSRNIGADRVKLINTVGVVVKTLPLGENGQKLDVSDLPPGLFILSFYDEENRMLRQSKIVKN